ncbi:mucin-12-like isoform X2 [Takifugu rubripes]|uniref:mucin-12-like isoform X2 n=1 Tax=Takifugu rubripes TaxID=31033 RepID=UPI001145E9FE|nr:mucin-12-like isoform X2 [Takifugu rubripes]
MDYMEKRGFSSDGTPRETHPEMWQQNEQHFKFSDSDQSASSSGHVFGSLKTLKRTDQKKRNDDLSSNSSSYLSENEITENTVNLDPEEDMEWNDNAPEATKDVLRKVVSVPIHGKESAVISPGLQGDYRYDTKSHAIRPKASFSSHSSESEDDTTIKQKQSARYENYSSDRVTGKTDPQQKVVPLPRTKLPGSFVIPTKDTSPDTKKPTSPAVYSSSSSSESELKASSIKRKQKRNKLISGAKVQASGNIRKTSSDSESSSTRGSESGTSQVQRHEQLVTSAPRPSVKASQTASSDHVWPAIDLQRTTRVKRRLDIKIQSLDSGSSSSSDSEEETGHITKQDIGQTTTTRFPPATVSQNASPDLYWPVINLEGTTKIKRRLDIKGTSIKSDTSTSSDSEDDTPHHIKKVEHWETSTLRDHLKESQIVNPDQHWPAIDLRQKTKVRRRLDIRIQSSDFNSSFSSVRTQMQTAFHKYSSSSSDNEDDRSHITKQDQRQTPTTMLPNYTSPDRHPDKQWPVINLEQTTMVKRHLDFKATSIKSDTSVSSESEDDSDHREKQRPGMVHGSQRPIQKYQSSSSSDSEDDTSHITKQDQLQTSTTRYPPIKVSPPVHPDHQWPAINLERTRKVKRRFDVRVTAHDSDSSSSSDSEDEPRHIKKQEQWQTSTPRIPKNRSPTGSPDQLWPAINLERTTKVKRRLDIKRTSFNLDTSSSSDSEDDRGHGDTQGPGKAGVTQFPVQESHSSFSSDSEDEPSRIIKQEQWQTSTTRLPNNTSPTGSVDNQWPAINLAQTTKVKRRLDIKATTATSNTSSTSDSEDYRGRPWKVDVHQPPVQESQSSSSSDSEDEPSHITKQDQWQTSTTRYPPIKVSPPVHPDHQWPAINLERTRKVKRRLDVRVTAHDSDSSSSSDSEDEPRHTTQQGQWQTPTTRNPSIKVSQTGRPDHQWPVVDLDHTRVKRHLDIKVKPHQLESSSSSDSEDGASIIKKQEQWQTSTRFPNTKSPSRSPDNQWPALNLDRRTKIKRRLDIKAPSSKSDTSSSSDSEDDRGHGDTQRPGKAGVTQFPEQESHSSFSSDSEDEPSRIIKQEQWQTSTTRLPNNISPTGRPDQQWPAISFQTTTKVKRRLDIKAPSYESDSSSSSDSENDKGGHTKPGLGVSVVSSNTKDFIKSSKIPLMQPFNKPKADDNIKLEKYIINNDSTDKTSSNSNKTPEISTELESRWAKMNLNKSRFRKHLEITSRKQEAPSPPLSPSPVSPSYTGYDRGTGSKLSTRGARGIIHTESKSDSGISVGRPRKGSSPSSDSSSSDEEDASRKDVSERWKGPARSSSQTYPSPVESSVFMKFDQPHSQTQEVKGQELDILADTDSLITYKRSIFKSTSQLSNATLPTVNNKHTKSTVGNDEVEGPSHSHGSREAPLSPKTFPSKNFDEVIKTRIAQSRTTTAVEVPPEIRWNGIGRQPMPISNPRSADGGELTQRWEPTKMEVSLLDDSNIPIGTNVLIPTEWRGSAISDPVSSRYRETVENSPSSPNKILRMQSDNGRERRGLNALKAMSSERKKWDMHSESVMDASPQFNGYESPISTRFYTGSSEGQKPQTQLPPYSNAEHMERVQHLVYGVPLYRRHAFGTTPPPIPATPPPDEIEIPAWRSPQSIERLPGIRTHPYQSGLSTTKSEDVAEHFDNPYISSV